MTLSTEHPHIVKTTEILSGEPVIQGTRISVRSVVENWRMGLSPEEILDAYPHLNLAQVFDALSYFCDHSEEIEAYIKQNHLPDDLIAPAHKLSR